MPVRLAIARAGPSCVSMLPVTQPPPWNNTSAMLGSSVSTGR